MKTKLFKSAAVASLAVVSVGAWAAGGCCGDFMDCCLQMLNCCL